MTNFSEAHLETIFSWLKFCLFEIIETVTQRSFCQIQTQVHELSFTYISKSPFTQLTFVKWAQMITLVLTYFYWIILRHSVLLLCLWMKPVGYHKRLNRNGFGCFSCFCSSEITSSVGENQKSRNHKKKKHFYQRILFLSVSLAGNHKICFSISCITMHGCQLHNEMTYQRTTLPDVPTDGTIITLFTKSQMAPDETQKPQINMKQKRQKTRRNTCKSPSRN